MKAYLALKVKNVMSYRKAITVLICCLVASAGFRLAEALPEQYQITDLGEIPPGAGAVSINDHNQIVGELQGRAVLCDNGKMTYLGAFATGWGDDVRADQSASRANSINNLGHIVGGTGGFQPIVMSGLYDCYPFLYAQGRMQNLSEPITTSDAYDSFEAFGINDRDEVVGLHSHHGFYWSQGKRIEYGTLHNRQTGTWSYSKITAINNKGQFVGESTVPGASPYEPKRHAVLWVGPKQGGHMQDLGVPNGYDNSSAAAINDKSEIVGNTETASRHVCAVRWKSGRMTLLSKLSGDIDSAALGINREGMIVGWSSLNKGLLSHHAILWQNGLPYNLNSLLPPDSGWTLYEATAINSHGWIVGNGAYTPPGRQQPVLHAFLLKPK